jgi:DNA-binding beta-propeller fold protein YncE
MFHSWSTRHRSVVGVVVLLSLMRFAQAPDAYAQGVLSFPGKVYAHAPSQRLFIADSNHNRIVIADFAGQVLAVAGSGAIGQADGPFLTATFNQPQGMTLDGHVLYVADTENHLIRRLDLTAQTVTTTAGTGEQARQANVPGTGTQVALNSPWDLQGMGTQLFIAMAGSHQVWVMDLETGYVQPYAGSGRENLVDGPRQQAAMAQPSGMTSDGAQLFVADSETSAIRVLDLGAEGTLRTIVGEGLFAFGDQDGTGKENVRLQHPLGLDYDGGVLYVADTYNHKIKKINPATATSMTYLGTGQPGHGDGPTPTFYEPGGVSIAAGQLYIADTNNHAIRVADLGTGEVSTLRLRGLAAPAAVADFISTSFSPDETIKVVPQQVRAGQAGEVAVHLELPAGYHLNPRAPLTYRVAVQGEGITVSEQDRRFQAIAPQLPLAISFQAAAGMHQAALDIDMTFYYCREDNTGVCAIQSVRWHVPLHTVDGDTAFAPRLSYKVTVPVGH